MAILIAALLGVFLLFSLFSIFYDVYQLIQLDARRRQIAHPRLWGFFAAGSQNGSGLFWYLIYRRRYPIIEADQAASTISQLKRQLIWLFGGVLVSGGVLLFLLA